MRFSTLIAFILPLSALAAPITVPAPADERVTGLRNLLDGIANASRIYDATLSLPFENADLRQSIALLHANIAVIPISGAVERASKAINEGGTPELEEYVDIAHWSK